MTASEFDDKYIKYLEEGHYGMAIDVPPVIRYLNKVFTKWSKIKGFSYTQLKVKYENIELYVENVPTELYTPVIINTQQIYELWKQSKGLQVKVIERNFKKSKSKTFLTNLEFSLDKGWIWLINLKRRRIEDEINKIIANG